MVKNYIGVLKPRESSLIALIGVGAAVIAGDGRLSPWLLLVALVILIASAGANGLTNYIDRDLDARMKRTCRRALPAQRIYPPQRVLPLLISLTVIGLVLAWVLHPFCFYADLTGTAAAVIFRKRWTCVFPQGAIASCAPVLMGWFAVKPVVDLEILLLCLLMIVWLPLHVWSVMVANRQDYIGAGLIFFPINLPVRDSVKILMAFALVLYATAIGLYFAGDFGWLYLVLANVASVAMVYACWRLLVAATSRNAWKLYKLSSFPYLGMIFLALCIDIWVT
ncbi:UbiA family prenyltransferase [Chloroflexota bacterium]